MITLYASALVAFASAMILAMFGFMKNMSDEDFAPDKIFSTLLAAVFVAFLTVKWAVEMNTATEMFTVFFAQTGAITLLERLLKFIWRSYLKDLAIFAWLKEE